MAQTLINRPRRGSSQALSSIEQFKAEHLRITEISSGTQALAAISEMKALGVREVGFDYETSESESRPGFGPACQSLRLAQIGFTDPRDGQRRQLLLDCHADEMAPALRELLADPEIEKQIHYSRFEQEFSWYALGQQIENVFDTFAAWQSVQKALGQLAKREHGPDLVAEFLPGWERSPNGLKDVARVLAGLELDKTEQDSDWSGPLTRSQRDYAALDVAVMPEIAPRLKELVHALGLDEEVAAKAAKARVSYQESWPPERLSGPESDGHALCWELFYAESGEQLEQVWASARRRPVSYPDKREFEQFYRERQREMGIPSNG